MAQSKTKPRLLIVDDNPAHLASYQRALRDDFEVVSASNASEAWERFKESPDLALLDIVLSEDDLDHRDGIELLKSFVQERPAFAAVMITGHGDVELAVECMRLGAADFVEKKATPTEIRQRLKSALRQSQESRRTQSLEEYIALKEPLEIVGQSRAVQEIMELISIVASDGHLCVLVRGETGTGKELVARAIHKSGWRAQRPFVPVAISALSEKLVESELFGHEKGAFTDAKEQRLGWIEKANHGVLFLDEIGDLPLDSQVKLLRFLQNHQLSRVGGRAAIAVDVQVISATHQNLEDLIKKGQFREDLYYRLKGFQIDVPPLRFRKDDIPLLAQHVLTILSKAGRTKIAAISEEALAALYRYAWPGNVRELKNVVERAAVVAGFHGHAVIEHDDLPQELGTGGAASPVKLSSGNGGKLSLAENVARTQLHCIDRALQQSDGKKTEAWKLLGLNDRFALTKLVKRIRKQFPNLLMEFPFLKKSYLSSDNASPKSKPNAARDVSAA